MHGAGFGTANRHLAFETFEITDRVALASHAYVHDLHHNYFARNCGGNGLVPLYKLFGIWHEGCREADAALDVPC